MQLVALLSGSAQLVLALVLGVGVTFAAFRLLARLVRPIAVGAELKAGNAAVGVLVGAMLLGCGVIVRTAVAPAASGLQTALFHGLGLGAALRLLGLWLLLVAVASAVAIVTMVAATRVFLRLTREVDELAEIGRGNLAVALTLGAVIVVMALLIAEGAGGFLAALVPYPAIESLEIMGRP